MSADLSRRRALAWLSGLAAGSAVPSLPAWARPAAAPVAPAQAFASSFIDVPDAWGPTRVPFKGRLPAGLAGTLYRNGPGRMQRGPTTWKHWFDGDGMVQALRLADGRLEHRGRAVDTVRRQAEERAGRFLWSGFGTAFDDARSVRSPDEVNVGNISVLPVGGELLALVGSRLGLAAGPADPGHARPPRDVARDRRHALQRPPAGGPRRPHLELRLRQRQRPDLAVRPEPQRRPAARGRHRGAQRRHGARLRHHRAAARVPADAGAAPPRPAACAARLHGPAAVASRAPCVRGGGGQGQPEGHAPGGAAQPVRLPLRQRLGRRRPAEPGGGPLGGLRRGDAQHPAGHARPGGERPAGAASGGAAAEPAHGQCAAGGAAAGGRRLSAPRTNATPGCAPTRC